SSSAPQIKLVAPYVCSAARGFRSSACGRRTLFRSAASSNPDDGANPKNTNKLVCLIWLADAITKAVTSILGHWNESVSVGFEEVGCRRLARPGLPAGHHRES